MGQYYRPLLITKKGKVKVYNRTVDGDYGLAKLMEHSWWLNPFVNTICKKIHFKPHKVAWVGDYADEEEDGFGFYEDVWGEGIDGKEVTEAQVLLWNKYLVNWTKKEYLDCDEYYEKSKTKQDFCIHPLPLLTAIGNGRGGGDYRGINVHQVGRWAMDVISVENKTPSSELGFKEIKVIFKEE